MLPTGSIVAETSYIDNCGVGKNIFDFESIDWSYLKVTVLDTTWLGIKHFIRSKYRLRIIQYMYTPSDAMNQTVS